MEVVLKNSPILLMLWALEQGPLTRGERLRMPQGKLPKILSEGNRFQIYRLLIGAMLCLVGHRNQFLDHTRPHKYRELSSDPSMQGNTT